MEVESNGVAWESTSVGIFGSGMAFANDNTSGDWTIDPTEDLVYSLICESAGGPGSACEQVFFDADQTTGIGFSDGNEVANDIVVAAGETFTMQTMTFDVVNLGGEPTEFDLEIYEDNGSGGVGNSTGDIYHFDSSNMTFVENGTFSIYTQYTVTLTLPNIELTADASDDARYWLAVASEMSTTGDWTYWVSYDYVTNPDSYPSWQYNDTDGWFEYVDSEGLLKEGIMTVSGICEGAGGGDECEWTVIVEDTSWGDEVEWELREMGGTVLLSGGGYGNGYYDEQSVTAAGPLEFWITNDGFFGDNTPTYSVSNGTEVLVSGTLNTADTLTFSDLNCDSGGGDPCDAVDVPYVQDFETATPPDMPECTTVVNAGSGNNWVTSTDEYGDFTGTFLEYEYHPSEPADSWFFTQGINLEAGTDYEITYGYGSRAAAAFPENLKVAFGDDDDPDAMTNLIAEHVAILSGGDKIMNTVEFTATTSGVFYFGFQAFSGANEWYLYLDDIEIKEADSGGSSDCISTIYDGGNNGSPGGAVYFDVTVDSEDIELTSIDLNIDGAGTGFTVDVYTIEGTHVGNETNQGAWTMRTSGSGTSAGEGSPSTATLDDTFVLSANTTYGIALVLDGTHSHYYTNGDGTNEHFENSDLALDLGAATNTPFSGTVFTPRVFNGGLCYNVGGGGTGDDCDQGDDSNGFENG